MQQRVEISNTIHFISKLKNKIKIIFLKIKKLLYRVYLIDSKLLKGYSNIGNFSTYSKIDDRFL